MLKSSFYLLIALLFSVNSQAVSEGTSEMNVLGGSLPEWSYSIEGNTVTGNIYGFSNATGRVNLTKGDEGWEGRFAMRTVDVRSVEVEVEDDGDIRTRIALRVFPGGIYTFNIKQEMEADEDGEFEISGFANTSVGGRSLSLRGHQDDEVLRGGNQFLQFNLSRDSDEMSSYDGFTSVYGPTGFPYNTYSTELATSGRLDPVNLIEEDKVLYLILYHLPFSLTAW